MLHIFVLSVRYLENNNEHGPLQAHGAGAELALFIHVLAWYFAEGGSMYISLCEQRESISPVDYHDDAQDGDICS